MATLRATAAIVLGVSWCLVIGPANATQTPEQKCESGKNKQAGKYAACLQNAQARYVATGDLTNYNNALNKCETKFSAKWQKLIDAATAASATCPDAPLTGAQFQTVIDECSSNITTALSGGGLEDCSGDLATCQSNLAACLASTLPADRVLQTGQAGCYAADGTGISCAGTGQDGELQKGVVRSYTDNGDGTITDNQTGLMWEKKSRDGTIHDQGNLYNWTDAFGVFIDGLNTASFAGYSDWRLPNRFELESLIDLGAQNPSVDTTFNNNCVASCTVTTCSCTASSPYWSSSTFSSTPSFAWYVFFNLGFDGFDAKSNANLVRAVRGGL